MRFKHLVLGLFAVLALIIVLDYFISGEVRTETIMQNMKNVEQHNNPSGNVHYSYKVYTKTNSFFVSEEFSNSIQRGEQVVYRISPLFKEINGYKTVDATSFHTYSLRIWSGLLIPILAVMVLLIAYRYPEKLSILEFIAQALLLADTAYLLFW